MIETKARVRAPELPADKIWLNCPGPVRLSELRGKLVLLDFWSYCCINCLHVLADLEKLERDFPTELVVIGVHSGKFPNEKGADQIRQAILRHGIGHPVVNDDDFSIWQSYTIRAWPTLVLIDPEGYIAGYAPGEGNYEMLAGAIGAIAGVYREAGLLNEAPIPSNRERERTTGALRFPGKVLADPATDRLFVSDSGNHRILVCGLDGTVRDTIGSGDRGNRDGPMSGASFDAPQGLALRGQDLLIADTGNHLIRACDLVSRKVTTAAGDGSKNQEIGAWKIVPARRSQLNSPWDLCLIEGFLFVAMAGQHQIWLYDLEAGEIGPFAGNGVEALRDGSLQKSSLAQPSGLTTNGTHLFVADSEASAVRAIPLDPKRPVTTVVGQGLFDFGDIDGTGDEVRLQHPVGITWGADALYLADTFNHKIKRLVPGLRSCRTLFGDGSAAFEDGTRPRFSEPSGLSYADGKLYVADTNNHRIRVADLESGVVKTLTVGQE